MSPKLPGLLLMTTKCNKNNTKLLKCLNEYSFLTGFGWIQLAKFDQLLLNLMYAIFLFHRQGMTGLVK